MVVDHILVAVTNYEDSVSFYTAALEPLGIKKMVDFPQGHTCGFGSTKADFWLTKSTDNKASALHVAFKADSRAEVDAFYKAALAAGGSDNGAPGIRRYSPSYYAAFVRDPVDGHNVEAVCNKPAN